MDKIEKGLQLLMWTVVVLMVIISFVVIIVGHATDYDFLFGFQDVPDLSKAIVSNSNGLL